MNANANSGEEVTEAFEKIVNHEQELLSCSRVEEDHKMLAQESATGR
jgi:hypothetical protein